MKTMTMTRLAFATACAVAGAAATARADHAGTTTTTSQAKWIALDAKAGDKGPQISIVFGALDAKAPIGFLFKTPPGFRPGPHTHSSDDYGVIVAGKMHNFAVPGGEGPALAAGEHWYQPGNAVHDNHCEAGSSCIVFVYMPNGFDFKPAK